MSDRLALASSLQAVTRLSRPRLANERVSAFLGGAARDMDAGSFENAAVRANLEVLADHSAFLWGLVCNDPASLFQLLRHPPQQSLRTLVSQMRARAAVATDDATILHVLRKARQQCALLVGLADIGGVWDVVTVTQSLTAFADAAVSAGLDYLLRVEAREGRLRLGNLQAPGQGCGMVVLALGKHGAGELNYSSDVDLMILFDPAAASLPAASEPQRLYVRLTQSLARLLQERTEDGHVHRVDLRLRPDPGSTSAAISLDAARDYYESVGQNWERAAMIKARPVAGDIGLGAGFLESLAPFIWRKYFDYAALADIHAMKRQIHAVRGYEEVAVAGHDVKLGRGGIREIEFFVQTQQLIFGGKRPSLRGRRTLDMLGELANQGWIASAAARQLTTAYKFLRGIEHRLQMLADEQTQRLPETSGRLKRFSRFCGYAGEKSFARALLRHLHVVERHYARLFEASPGLDNAHGSLVFTGTVDDPETLATLQKMGFRDAALAAETVRGWHFGRRTALQSARAREVLTELVPALLQSFAGSGEPDDALSAFDAALARMPAAIELMSILRSNSAVRDLFADVLGGAPLLAQAIVARPHVLDAFVTPGFHAASLDPRHLDARVDRINSSSTFEEFLDAARDLAHEEKFRIGIGVLSQRLSPQRAGADFSKLADALIGASLAQVEQSMQREFGVIRGGERLVLGLGKLGSREMTYASDLDLMIIYDFPRNATQSDGPRKLHPLQYYARLTQRLITALTVATTRGGLYEVDMRLRPSGNKGPLATQFSAFADYQSESAETWERMALTRARPVCGDTRLAARVRNEIYSAFCRRRDKNQIRQDVVDMRRLIASEKGEDDPWDLKLASGGLLDIEFISQYLALTLAQRDAKARDRTTRASIEVAQRSNLLSPDDAATLMEAFDVFTAATQVLRAAVPGRIDPQATAPAVLRRLAVACGAPDFVTLHQDIARHRRDVRAIFERLLNHAAG